VVAEPDKHGGEQQVPDDLVKERGLERAELRVAKWPVLERYDQAPRQGCRASEQLLVEVVADPADGLSDQQRRRDRVGEQSDARTRATYPPRAYQGASRDAAPHPKATRPHSEHAVPHMRDLVWRRDVEVDPAADDASRNRPQCQVADQSGIAADLPHPPLGDEDGKRYADHVHQPVVVDEQRAEVEAVARRARYEAQRNPGMRGHARKTRPARQLLGARTRLPAPG